MNGNVKLFFASPWETPCACLPATDRKRKTARRRLEIEIVDGGYGWYGGRTMVLLTRTLKRYPGRILSVGADMLQKNLNIAPTLKIRPGYLFNVLVSKTMVLPPYRP